MDPERHSGLTLEQIPADRRLIEELSSHGFITQMAKAQALELLYPHKAWGLWISRLLLMAGTSLVLAGVVYFFAFNWMKIPPGVKLGLIEFAILACAVAVYRYGFERLVGKILLLSASVLVGVFWAVFGQIYQTGADAYTLFAIWALLIAGWVVVAEFAPLWAVWLVVTNIALFLYWEQAILPEREIEMFIASILAAFNLVFLILREALVYRGVQWLSERWTRLILIVPILFGLLVPSINFIWEPGRTTTAITFGAMFSVVTHLGLFILYRRVLLDMWVLATVFLSGCIILENAAFKLMWEIFDRTDAALFLITGLITIAIFTFAIAVLRQIARRMETANVL